MSLAPDDTEVASAVPSAGRRTPGQRFTLVSFHAHPDDEALLTGGTLAAAAADGHRVVLVTATRGELGLAGAGDGTGEQLGGVRLGELEASARALGVARVAWLGYADSGLRPEAGSDCFAHTDVEAAAEALAAVLREEQADALTVYDARGGYGHPDHVQVHRVGSRAAALAGTPVVLEATVSAGLFRAVLWTLRRLGRFLGRAPLGTDDVFTSGRLITHRVDVRSALPAKRAALAAHASQGRAEGESRVMDHLLRLPAPLFALAFGREWFREQGRTPRPGLLRHQKERDVFASLRAR